MSTKGPSAVYRSSWRGVEPRPARAVSGNPGILRAMPRLEGADVVGEDERGGDEIAAGQEGLLPVRLDIECDGAVAAVEADRLRGEIDGEVIARIVRHDGGKLGDDSGIKRDRQQAVVGAIVVEDSCEGGADQRADAELLESPDGVLAAR